MPATAGAVLNGKSINPKKLLYQITFHLFYRFPVNLAAGVARAEKHSLLGQTQRLRFPVPATAGAVINGTSIDPKKLLYQSHFIRSIDLRLT